MYGIKNALVSSFILLVIFSAIIIFALYRAVRGKIPLLRRLAPIDAIEETIGRAVEMGSPVIYFSGEDMLMGASTLASIAILGYVAKVCARLGVELLLPSQLPTAFPMQEEIIKKAYEMEDRLDLYKPENVVFLSQKYGASMTGIGWMYDRKIKASFYIGGLMGNSVMIVENASRVGAMQIGGGSGGGNLSFVLAACDYTLIGEELFAAGAYLSEDPVTSATLIGQDYGKVLCILLLILGVILNFANVDIFSFLGGI